MINGFKFDGIKCRTKMPAILQADVRIIPYFGWIELPF
jgi:hypothetical protein